MMPRHVVSLAVMVLLGGRADRQPLPPRPIRNDEPRRGTEVLVLRHQQLRKGAHEQYYESSRDGVWPWYERIGARVVGQWLVIPEGGAGEFDDAYRLARYASFEHWRATRDTDNASLGNGPNREKSLQSGRDRTGVQTGSKGAYFLQGQMAPDGPLDMPGLAEQYAVVDANRQAAATDRSHAYAATPLTGVWANYPYLHNGSVPTLYHLLGPVSERPKICLTVSTCAAVKQLASSVALHNSTAGSNRHDRGSLSSPSFKPSWLSHAASTAF